MENPGRFKAVTISPGKSILFDEDRRQKIRRFRGILGKADEDTIAWRLRRLRSFEKLLCCRSS